LDVLGKRGGAVTDSVHGGRLTLSDESAVHQYATSESFTIDVPRIQSFGSLTEDYRIEAGFYSTGDSGVWVLPPEGFRTLLSLQLGERIPLNDLIHAFIIEGAQPLPALFPQRIQSSDLLLERIRTRRKMIHARCGTLPESVPLIREDRQR
jgi:hypothetical protein